MNSGTQDPERPTPFELTSFNEFANALTALYGDPNLETTSERSINKLTQTTSVSAYIVEFQRLWQYITWNESALRDRFYRSLKDNVKDEFTRLGRPNTLTAMMEIATRFDARIRGGSCIFTEVFLQ